MKKSSGVIVFLCACLFFAACSDEKENEVGLHESDRIQLFIPDAQEVQVYSTATERENYIEDCFVVTFSGGNYKNAEKVDVSLIVKNGMAAALLPQLSFKMDLGDKVYVLCNTGLAALPGGINTESDINDKFKPAKDYYFGGEALPMSGSINWSSSSTVVTMTRAVAKVQVKLGESFNVGGDAFEPSIYWNVDDFHERHCGFVVSNYAAKSDIVSPISGLSQNLSGLPAFYGTTSENKFIRFLQYADTEDYMTIYISEYPNSTKDCEGNTIADDEFYEKRHFLLMIDSVAHGSATVGNGQVGNAWRLDFYDAATGKYLDIKRNHHYIFTVQKIRSAPYLYWVHHNWVTIRQTFLDDQEVWHNPGSNIEYTIYVKDNWVNATYSNGQYALSVSTDTIRDASIPFRLKAEIPTGVDYSQIKTRILYVYDRNGTPIGNTGHDLEVNGYPLAAGGITFPTDGTVTTLDFTVNNYQYLDSAYMVIWLGNIYKKIPMYLTP